MLPLPEVELSEPVNAEAEVAQGRDVAGAGDLAGRAVEDGVAGVARAVSVGVFLVGVGGEAAVVGGVGDAVVVVSGSQASPSASPSLFSCAGFATEMQLSWELAMPSPSVSGL